MYLYYGNFFHVHPLLVHTSLQPSVYCYCHYFGGLLDGVEWGPPGFQQFFGPTFRRNGRGGASALGT